MSESIKISLYRVEQLQHTQVLSSKINSQWFITKIIIERINLLTEKCEEKNTSQVAKFYKNLIRVLDSKVVVPLLFYYFFVHETSNVGQVKLKN